MRAYRARQAMYQYSVKRRLRDNIAAGIGVVVVLVLAVVTQLLYFGEGPGKVTPSPTNTASPSTPPSPSTTPSPSATPQGENQGDVPDASVAEGRTWTGTLAINDATLGIELDGAAAPQAVSSAVSLIRSGFYTGTVCHRLTVADGFKVLQCGDPNGDDPAEAGKGGPGYSYGPIENAPADDFYPAGTIAMARQSGNAYSMGSQFFIVYGDTTIPADAAGGYTVIGHVTSGLDELEQAVTSAGVEGGQQDGTPVVTPTITEFTIQ